MYTLNLLEKPFEALAYQTFTFPLFRPHLQVLKPGSSIVAIAASNASEPIGLALSEIQPNGKLAQVLSIFVAPFYRRQGIGTALLRRLESQLRSQGCTHLELVYTTGKTTTPALERLLEICDWNSPQPRMLVGKSTYSSMINAPWMKRTALPASYSLFPWQEITQDDRTALEQQTNSWIPSQLMPFQHEQNLEPLNSLGLRYQGDVVGWIITHRLDPETIRYTSGFVRPDLQKAGRYISLIANAIQLQIDAKVLFGIWTVPFVYPAMVSFVRQRMLPYMIAIEESRISSKNLIQHPVKIPATQIV
ncbi:GNAT family N-acetyltransferase [Nostoc sp. UHCC 0251]|uniref:GNAT family N-acetyltransferase n=1 Tax=Nostoc sp. UHCC 0251 TaxID=3110240 RepID=UPI002B220FA0|nr:GNAT family N-acetyltransferase [Nostoc sp. UHCC 0251]MEA5627194.1 GNAT family N-acetyltransferase [Nostoc sp. UHCC 0251]